MQATLTSAKATEIVTGELADVLAAAIRMDESLQPAYGVTIECDDGRTFECRECRVAVMGDVGGDDEDEGHVYIDPDGALMIAWDGGAQRTRFFDAGLQAA